MRKENYPTQSELRELFEYNDGELIYKERNTGSRGDKRFNTMYAGKPAGCLKKDGYFHISINKRTFLRSNLVWIFHNGAIPEGKTIDHIHITPSIDKIEELRLADKTLQNINKNQMKKRSDLPKGLVRIFSQSGREFYQAKIRFPGGRKYLGTFETIKEAEATYKAAEKERDALVIKNQ